MPGLQIASDAVQNGTVEMGHSASYYYFGKDPTFAFGTSVAFGPNARLNQGWWTLGGGKEVLNEFYAPEAYNQIGAARGQHRLSKMGESWFRKRSRQHARRSSRASRCASGSGFPATLLQKLGPCRSLESPGGDIYPALEKGTLDACEWVGPYDDEKLGFYKIAPHYYYPGWWEGGSMIFAFVNLDKWNSLPKLFIRAITRAGGSTTPTPGVASVRPASTGGGCAS